MSKKEKAYNELRKSALKINKKLKALKKNADRENPIDMDLIKTTKAMFYEIAVEIFKQNKEDE